jgi:mono/diheme cytochrome c family protein
MKRQLQMAGVVLLAATMATPILAQNSGAEVYKTKCQGCHGVSGMADSGAGKAMKVKPVTDPDVKKMSQSQMVEAVRNGMGKMQAYKGKLTEAQIKDAVAHFRTFLK